MNNKVIILAVVFCLLGAFVDFGSKLKSGESVSSIINEVTMRREFDPPGVWRPGPYGTSIRWVKTIDKKPIKDVLNFLRAKSKEEVESPVSFLQSFIYFFGATGRDIFPAHEYGSLVQALYVESEGVGFTMLNPEIQTLGTEMFYCEDDIGGDIVTGMRFYKIRVRFINEEFKDDEIEFQGDLSCSFQSVAEAYYK